MTSIPKFRGVTLLEMLLVLTIGITFLVMGFRLYQRLNIDNQAQQVKSNIDMLFLGMKNYYQANCGYHITDESTGALAAKDATLVSSTASSPYLMTINTLMTGGYLDTTWNSLPQPPSIISSTSDYVLQFNRVVGTQNIYAGSNVNYCTTASCYAESNLPNTKVIVWKIQVSLKIEDATKIDFYKDLLGADCISNLSGTTVVPCASASPGGNYLVWERLPSFATPSSNPETWPLEALLHQSRQLYENDPNYSLNKNDSSFESTSHYQTYLCGG